MQDADLVICDHCDAVHRRQPLAGGAVANCARCGQELYRARGRHLDITLALAWSALICFVITNAYPLVSADAQGNISHATLWGAILSSDAYGLGSVSVLVALCTFLLPLLQILVTLYLATGLRLSLRPPAFITLVLLLDRLRPWSMVEVLLLAVFIASVKLGELAQIEVGTALWGLVGLTLLITALDAQGSDPLWEAAEALEG
jgi:Uncharacterized paraquat-inducible protein A